METPFHAGGVGHQAGKAACGAAVPCEGQCCGQRAKMGEIDVAGAVGQMQFQQINRRVVLPQDKADGIGDPSLFQPTVLTGVKAMMGVAFLIL